MIKLKPIVEIVRLNSIKEVESIKKELAASGQAVYDDWIQDENGNHVELGSGGICHLIADAMIDVLYNHGINRVQTVSSTHEQHVYLVGQFREGIYMIDIHWSNYETGGGFTWKKIPDVIFDENYITIYKLDSNPRNIKPYTDND
jgi:hypothetical protein